MKSFKRLFILIAGAIFITLVANASLSNAAPVAEPTNPGKIIKGLLNPTCNSITSYINLASSFTGFQVTSGELGACNYVLNVESLATSCSAAIAEVGFNPMADYSCQKAGSTMSNFICNGSCDNSAPDDPNYNNFYSCLGTDTPTIDILQSAQWANCQSVDPDAASALQNKLQQEQQQQQPQPPTQLSDHPQCMPNPSANAVKNNGPTCYCTYKGDDTQETVKEASDPYATADNILINPGCNVNDKSTQPQGQNISALTGHPSNTKTDNMGLSQGDWTSMDNTQQQASSLYDGSADTGTILGPAGK